MSRRRRLAVASLGIALSVGAGGGCVTDSVASSTGRPLPPPPRRPISTPESVPIDRVVLLKAVRPDDSDGDGFPNRLSVNAYLFNSKYPSPRWCDGAFVFSLYPLGMAGSPSEPGTVMLAQWRIDGPDVEAARGATPIGPVYQFELDLRDLGIRSLPVREADLRACFIPADGGEPVFTEGVRTIRYLP